MSLMPRSTVIQRAPAMLSTSRLKRASALTPNPCRSSRLPESPTLTTLSDSPGKRPAESFFASSDAQPRSVSASCPCRPVIESPNATTAAAPAGAMTSIARQPEIRRRRSLGRQRGSAGGIAAGDVGGVHARRDGRWAARCRPGDTARPRDCRARARSGPPDRSNTIDPGGTRMEARPPKVSARSDRAQPTRRRRAARRAPRPRGAPASRVPATAGRVGARRQGSRGDHAHGLVLSAAGIRAQRRRGRCRSRPPKATRVGASCCAVAHVVTQWSSRAACAKSASGAPGTRSATSRKIVRDRSHFAVRRRAAAPSRAAGSATR